MRLLVRAIVEALAAWSERARRDTLNRRAQDVARGVEEHFAAILKANAAAEIRALDKANTFVERIRAAVPALDRAAALVLAEEAVAAIGLGASTVGEQQ